MRYIFDTNVVSELQKDPARTDPAVCSWAISTHSHEVSISAVTLFELARGIARIQHRDPHQARRLQERLDHSRTLYNGRILPIDAEVSQAAALLHAPDPRPILDSLIAATAIVHGLTVVTRNIKDFEPMGVPVINPWER